MERFENIDFSRLSLTSILGATWAWVTPMYTHLAATVPLTAMCLLWCADMFFGVALSVRLGGLRAISLRRMDDGIAKLAKYGIVLLMTCILRDSSNSIGILMAAIIEVHVLLRLLGSVLRSIGKIFHDPGIERAGEFVEGRAGGLFANKEDK